MSDVLIMTSLQFCVSIIVCLKSVWCQLQLVLIMNHPGYNSSITFAWITNTFVTKIAMICLTYYLSGAHLASSATHLDYNWKILASHP